MSTARVYRPTERNISLLARRLRAGEIVGVPTETVYGLAGNALDSRACARIFRAKGRPAEDPLIVHVHSFSQLAPICDVNAAARTLANAFWPGPLTLILPKTDLIPGIVTAGRDSVAVRIPSHPVFRRLLAACALPLAAPSANRFGYLSPTCAAHVLDGLGKKIRFILDGGPSRVGVESTIVDLRDPARPAILRPGIITAAAIKAALGGSRVARTPRSRPDSHAGLIAPGLLARHYSPRTPLVLHERLRLPLTLPANEAFLFLRKPRGVQFPKNIVWLDARGELGGVARRLFATLRKLDAMRFKVIHAELAPGSGVADAINDRLRRAAAR